MATADETIEIERALLRYALRCPNEWVPFIYAELETWCRPKVPFVRRVDLLYALKKLSPHILSLRRLYGGQVIEFQGINQSPSDFFDGDEYGIRETGATKKYLDAFPPEDETLSISDPAERRTALKAKYKALGTERLLMNLNRPQGPVDFAGTNEKRSVAWDAYNELKEEAMAVFTISRIAVLVRNPGTPEEARFSIRVGGTLNPIMLVDKNDTVKKGDHVICEDLSDEPFVVMSVRKIPLLGGISHIEVNVLPLSEVADRERFIERLGGTRNTIYGGVNNSSILQAGSRSEQKVIVHPPHEEIVRLVELVKNNLDKTALDIEQKEQIHGSLARIEKALSETPRNSSAITSALSSMRTIFENVAGDLISSGIMFEIGKLLGS